MATSTEARKAAGPGARLPPACAADALVAQALVVDGRGFTALRLLRVRSTEGLSRPGGTAISGPEGRDDVDRVLGYSPSSLNSSLPA